MSAVGKWNDNKPHFVFILDEETTFVFTDKYNNSFVQSGTELDKINWSQENPAAIIIFAELEWEGKLIQHFHGFDIALELRRRHKLLCPLIIVSTFPQAWFEHYAEKELKYQILFGRGTAFLHVTEIDEKLESTIQSVQPLSEAVLADMNEMLLNLKGMVIDRLTHDLRPEMVEERLRQTLGDISPYLSQQQLNILTWTNFEEQLSGTLGNSVEFGKVKDSFLLKCEQELVSSNAAHQNVADKRHKVLFLEDDPDFADQIKQNLEDQFAELLITNHSTEAIQLLDSDETNSITGIIADWRLYSDPKKRYWQVQGYEVLEYASKRRMMALFGLTSLSDRNVHNIRNLLGLDIHLFKKNQLLSQGDAQWMFMADIIKQRCDQVVDVITSQPNSKNWENFKEAYKLSRNMGWQSFEYEVSSEATRIYNYYVNALSQGDIRNVYSINEMGLSLKNNLKGVLIIRRVFFGIYFSLVKSNNYLQEINSRLLGDGDNFDTELRHHSVDVYSILRKDWWEDISSGLDSTKVEEEWSKFDQRMKNLRGALCIELNSLPAGGLLPEEKGWFSKNQIDYSFLFNYWSADE